jgi:3-hydroxyisobutyrate dehydrogenase-like beta-hydroxyacid dehydrogenase
MNPLRQPADRPPPMDRSDAPEATLSVIGLGQLGLAVAAALAANGAAVTVHDRDPGRVALACEHGAQAAGGTAQAARADVVVTLLPDDDRLHALVHEADGLLAVMSAGALHLCLGTISVALAGELAAAHRATGQFFIASPVFGRPEEAWASDLTAVLGADPTCPPDVVQRARAVLARVAPRIHETGSPEAACAVKLAGNLLIGSAIAAMTEAFGLARRHGAPPALVHEVITGKLFRGPVYETTGRVVADAATDAPEIAPGFTVRLGLKDLTLARDAARARDWPMPLADTVHTRLAAAERAGHGARDWAELPSCLSPTETPP